MKIGVFDSGIGGLSVAHALEGAQLGVEVIYRHDTSEHFPYATKTPEDIYGFVLPVLQSLVDDGCGVIVVACNTVSTTLMGRLRQRFTVPLIAVEPMVRTAASMTKSGIIAVCATPTTLASYRYAELKSSYASDIVVIEPDCRDWSQLIERSQMTEARLQEELEPVVGAGADVVVLGCTHYHWIEEEVHRIVGNEVEVIQPEQAIIDELKRVLARLL